MTDTSGTNLYHELREELKELLHKKVVTVFFTKKDGTLRKMDCTLLPEHLPVVEKREGDEVKPSKKQSDESLAVWDIEAKAWRSFRIDSVKSYIAPAGL